MRFDTGISRNLISGFSEQGRRDQTKYSVAPCSRAAAKERDALVGRDAIN